MPSLKLLIVAPQYDDVPPLPNITAEIAAIHRHHETKILTGVVRDLDIAQAVGEDVYDGIWFIAHGAEGGVKLSGEWLAQDALIQYIRVGDMSLCVLNSCSSEEVARHISAGSDADVICTITQINNPDAIRLGMLLAEELAAEQSYYEAFEIVAPPGGNYRYYRAKDPDVITRSSRRGGHSEEWHELRADVNTIRSWLIMIGVVLIILVLAFTIAYANLWSHMDKNFDTLFNLLVKGRGM